MTAHTQTNTAMRRHLIPALVLIVLGTLFLLDNLGFAGIDVSNLISTWWPALLILAGVNLLLKRMGSDTATCRN